MKVNLIKTAVIGALMLPMTTVLAEETTSEWSVGGNVGLYSDYVFRGYTQTQHQPALQGGFDAEHSSGFYIGTWASNVDWTTAGGYMKDNSIEIDVYGGYATEVAGIGIDLGILQFLYPGDNVDAQAETDATELYIGLSKDLGIASVGVTMYYVVSTDAWGFSDAEDSIYWDLALDVPLGDTPITASLHWGDQTFEGASNAASDYSDWKVDVSYAINDNFTAGVFYTDTDQDKSTSYWTVDSEYLGEDVWGGYLSAGF